MIDLYSIVYRSQYDGCQYTHIVQGRSKDHALERLQKLARINEDTIEVLSTEGPLMGLMYRKRFHVEEVICE